MTHLKALRLVCILVALLAVFAVRTVQAAPTTTTTIQCDKWNVVASPNLGGDSLLFADTMPTPSQAWAVGTYAVNRNQTVFDPLIEHYC